VPEVRLTRNAERDLRRIGPGPERTRIVAALKALSTDAAYLDIKALVGAKHWLRLRVGDYRLLYWQRPDNVYEIGRIVHRRDLDASIATLPVPDSEG
jgi:mRNA-degrading endonuclease RelE of RelBE toxin-antitoxin system